MVHDTYLRLHSIHIIIGALDRTLHVASSGHTRLTFSVYAWLLSSGHLGRGALEGPPRHVETLTFQGASVSSSGHPHLSYTGPGRGGGCERAAVCGPRGLVRAQVTRPAPPWKRRARATCSPSSTPPELMQWIVDRVFSFDVRGTKAAWQNYS
jgi:hypothetical protein